MGAVTILIQIWRQINEYGLNKYLQQLENITFASKLINNYL